MVALGEAVTCTGGSGGPKPFGIFTFPKIDSKIHF